MPDRWRATERATRAKVSGQRTSRLAGHSSGHGDRFRNRAGAYAEGARLVDKVRELSSGPNNRLWAGGRDAGGLLGGAGADFVIEAVGADAVAPKLEAGPDSTGILPLRQAYEMTAPGGHIVTTSLPRGTLSLPAVLFTIGGRTHHAGQAGGCNPMRDIPRFVELLDKGQFNAKALATSVVPIDKMLDAYQEVAYRTTVTAIMTA